MMFALLIKGNELEINVSIKEELRNYVKTTGNVCVLNPNINLTSTVEIKDVIYVTILLDKTGVALEITANDCIDPLFKVNNGKLVIDGVSRITVNIVFFIYWAIQQLEENIFNHNLK